VPVLPIDNSNVASTIAGILSAKSPVVLFLTAFNISSASAILEPTINDAKNVRFAPVQLVGDAP